MRNFLLLLFYSLVIALMFFLLLRPAEGRDMEGARFDPPPLPSYVAPTPPRSAKHRTEPSPPRNSAQRLYNPAPDYFWNKPGEHTGIWSYYNQNPTDGTIAYHQKTGRIPDSLPEDLILVALLDCGRVGSYIKVDMGDGIWRDALVFDCGSNPETIKLFSYNNVLGEVDYYTAKRFEKYGGHVFPGRVIYFS